MSGDHTMSSLSESRATLRQGIALPIALAAIVTVGALIAGVFFASTQEYRAGRNTLAAERALHGAEVGLSSILSSWTAARTADTKVGRTVTFSDTTINGATVKREYTRVSPTVFWLTSTAEAGGLSLHGRAVRRLNTVVRIETPDFKIMGALTVRGKINLTGTAAANGRDTVPPGWDCPPAGPPVAGLVVGDSATGVTSAGTCAGFACVTGNPKVKDSTALVNDTTSFLKFGSFSYDSLAKLADKVITSEPVSTTITPRDSIFSYDSIFVYDSTYTDTTGTYTIPVTDTVRVTDTVVVADTTYKAGFASVKPSATGMPAACNTADMNNWGDTSQVNGPRTCANYYPIVHLKGGNGGFDNNWTLANFGGQGILLIDGNVMLTGGFRWTGLILAKGHFKATGNTAPRVIGAVMAMAGMDTISSTMAGNATVQYSRCALNSITARRAAAAPMKHRAWADLSF
jgi:hypothetical protein